MRDWIQMLTLAGFIVLAGFFVRLQAELREVGQEQSQEIANANAERARAYMLLQEVHSRFGDTGPVLEEVRKSRSENQLIQEEIRQSRDENQKLMELMDPKARSTWHAQEHRNWAAAARR